MKAMILAAGLGTRLRPLTLERAKPAIPMLGKPLVVRLLERLMDQGARRFRLNLHHLPESIERIFCEQGMDRLPVSFSYEQQILGTAGGLKANESFFDDEPFLMVNGDIIMEFPLNRAIEFHREREALATLILYPQKPPFSHTQVRIDEEGRLYKFKNTDAPTGTIRPEVYVFTGVHVLDPAIFQFIPPGQFHEINDGAYPAAIKEGKRVYGFPIQGYWNDVGDPSRYLAAQADLLRRAKTRPAVCVSPGAKVDHRAHVGPYVSVEPGCVIEKDAELENAILWEDVTVKNATVVRNSIVGSGMTVRSECVDRILTRNGEIPIATR